ncbi:MAG: hypothetical protein WC497_00375 [Patescibacteria group bacterium]
MLKTRTQTRKYSWHAGINSGGNLSLMLTMPAEVTTDEKEKELADGIAESVKLMRDKGYLSPEARFMTSSDLSNDYGFTRQYWEKLLKEGKILYKEAAAGMITTDIWVQGYLGNKEMVDRYARNCKSVAAIIKGLKERYGVTTCTDCGSARFEYNKNATSTNGLCRTCGFRVHVAENN